MIISEQVASYLTAQGVGSFSKLDDTGNIYIDTLKDTSNTIALYNRAGDGEDLRNGYRRVGLQVLYRGDKNPVTSFEVAQGIFTALNGFKGYFVEGQNYIVNCSSSQGQAEGIGKSESLNYEYSMNFIIEYKR